MTTAPTLRRRAILAAVLAGTAAVPAGGTGLPEVRLGLLQFGTIQWLADVVRRRGLDVAHGFALRPVTLANNDAGRIALMAGSADVVLTDWLFAAKQRQAGTLLSFAPFSSAAGGVMAAAGSPIHGLSDLRGRKLGVAGGPLDRSWLLVQAAARAADGIDLASAASVVYGAPPLLSAKLRQGELDAVLTFWTFAAGLEADGFREAVSVADATRALGLPERLSLLGFVFHSDWAAQNRAAVDGLLAAMADAQALLGDAAPGADAEWASLRPLMQVPAGAAGDGQFERLRRRFLAGLHGPAGAEQERVASQVLDVLKRVGGGRATEGVDTLPVGLFWPPGG